MLINFENGKEIKEVWHKKEYDVWISKIEKYDKNAIENMKSEICKHLTEKEIVVTSWLPGKDWEGTPFYPIYEALKDIEIAGMCFGLLFQECIIDDENKWSFTRIEDAKGMCYFKMNS